MVALTIFRSESSVLCLTAITREGFSLSRSEKEMYILLWSYHRAVGEKHISSGTDV